MAKGMEAVSELKKALDESHYTVTITGAGISVAAGGVTYSGMAKAGARTGMRSGDPNELYKYFYNAFLGSMFEHGPTEAHKALARLEEMGKMQGIITTNVDCMHTMAGSRNVAEIQGSFQVNVCPHCYKTQYGYEIWREGRMPQCEHCGNYLLPYNIYSHAGILDTELYKAQNYMKKADLVLIIGANGCYTHLYWYYMKHGTKIIQINPSRTYFDSVACLNIREEADPVFIELMRLYDEEKSNIN